MKLFQIQLHTSQAQIPFFLKNIIYSCLDFPLIRLFASCWTDCSPALCQHISLVKWLLLNLEPISGSLWGCIDRRDSPSELKTKKSIDELSCTDFNTVNFYIHFLQLHYIPWKWRIVHKRGCNFKMHQVQSFACYFKAAMVAHRVKNRNCGIQI